MSKGLHYGYRTEWSEEDEAFVATAVEFPSLSWVAEEAPEALRGLESLIASVIADLAANGETVPTPLVDRVYSGKLSVRISPSLHKKVALRAAEEKVSINRLVSQVLAEV
ncbi:type II toxin-antitoxin system HicB family antitoxin [Agrococcus sp. KRD186]|jgi:predicted HicB family RNase H-like nuclease|uniref:type II toxin-antitoxin system HicB family antitoxin n=1 Tax=Agrococcus sp. KRD186 TaxID=2729730 RepID=UPI0019D0717F|nr:toxin-antitoxin system HicB family antitoxin [Agrococcus sp. KRD186]